MTRLKGLEYGLANYQETLEALVDRHGLFSVLNCLSGICGRKAEHIKSNWQDSNLAENWESAESAIDAAASRVLDLYL